MNIQKFMRGQLWWVRMEEDRPTIPIIIVSNNQANKFSKHITVIPCTSTEKKDLPTHVKLEINGPSTALAENITTICINQFMNYIGTCDNQLMERIDKSIRIALALEETHQIIATDLEGFNDGFTEEELEKEIKRADEIVEVKAKKQRGKKPLSPEYKKLFIEEYKSKGVEFVMNKYNIKTPGAVKTRISDYKKYMEKHNQW